MLWQLIGCVASPKELVSPQLLLLQILQLSWSEQQANRQNVHGNNVYILRTVSRFGNMAALFFSSGRSRYCSKNFNISSIDYITKISTSKTTDRRTVS